MASEVAVMKEFVQAVSSFTLGMSFLGLKLATEMLIPTERGERRGPATKTLDSVAHATSQQFGPTLRATYRAVDNIQRGIAGIMYEALWPGRGTVHETRHDHVKSEHYTPHEAYTPSQEPVRADAVLSHPVMSTYNTVHPVTVLPRTVNIKEHPAATATITRRHSRV
jgi:hypothetical protein